MGNPSLGEDDQDATKLDLGCFAVGEAIHCQLGQFFRPRLFGLAVVTSTITNPGVGTALCQAHLIPIRSGFTLSILLLRLSVPPQPHCLR